MSLDIENVSETDNQYIEMVHLICQFFSFVTHALDLQNLGLGVLEDRNKSSHRDSGSGSDSEDEDLSSSDSSSGSSDGDDNESSDVTPSEASRPIKPLPKRTQPQPEIVELSDPTS
jgi:hypothetical protein